MPRNKRPKYASDLSCDPEQGMTQQAFADSVDINNIVKQFDRTGVISHTARSQGEYGYMPSVDFKTAMDAVATVSSRFMELPAETRAHFSNSVTEFLSAAENPDRKQEFVDLGLVQADLAAPITPDPEPDPEPASAEN